MNNISLTLLPGTQLVLGSTQTIILPEDFHYLIVGEEVTLENEQREALGSALIKSVQVMCYAQLQQFHFKDSAHSGLTSWHGAAETLKALVPGFSICDQASIISVEVTTLLEPSFTIHAASPSAAVDAEPVPTVDEVIKMLEEESNVETSA